MKNISFLLFLLTLFMVNGCKKNSDTTEPQPAGNTGTADFTNFVTIGNSITAGYQSNALFETAQKYSYGNQISQQVKTNFVQPLITDPGMGGRIELKGFTSTLSPILVMNSTLGTPENSNYSSPYNNLGVPGATVYDVLNATNSTNCFSGKAGSPNPMFDVILRNSALNKGSQFQQAKALKATFVTLWIGNNDVLGYATSGGTVPFTPTSTFTALYQGILDSLASLKAGVVVANIPNVTSIPFFTTVGPALAGSYPGGFWAVGSKNDTLFMSFKANYLTLQASYVLTDQAGNPTGIGTSKLKPFPNSVVLDSTEALAAMNTLASYNSTIASLASAKGYGLVDINYFFNQFKQTDANGGTTIESITFKTDFISGGLFSLDGVHPTSRAQGLIANEFIKVINTKFNASIPAVSVSSIPVGFQKALSRDHYGIPVVPKDTFNNILF